MPHRHGDRARPLLRAGATETKKEPIMKRFHVHVAVDDLDANVRFYSTVFGAQPTVQKPVYAQWMLGVARGSNRNDTAADKETLSRACSRGRSRRERTFLFDCFWRAADGAKAGLRQVDARGSAHQFRCLPARNEAGNRPPGLSGRFRRG